MLPLQAKVDLGVMAIKGYSIFPKVPALLTIRLFSVISSTLVGGESYHCAEMQSVYSAAPADWVEKQNNVKVDRVEVLRFKKRVTGYLVYNPVGKSDEIC